MPILVGTAGRHCRRVRPTRLEPRRTETALAGVAQPAALGRVQQRFLMHARDRRRHPERAAGNRQQGLGFGRIAGIAGPPQQHKPPPQATRRNPGSAAPASPADRDSIPAPAIAPATRPGSRPRDRPAKTRSSTSACRPALPIRASASSGGRSATVFRHSTKAYCRPNVKATAGSWVTYPPWRSTKALRGSLPTPAMSATPRRANNSRSRPIPQPTSNTDAGWCLSARKRNGGISIIAPAASSSANNGSRARNVCSQERASRISGSRNAPVE